MKTEKKVTPAKKDEKKSVSKIKNGKPSNAGLKKNTKVDTDFHHEHPFSKDDQ